MRKNTAFTVFICFFVFMSEFSSLLANTEYSWKSVIAGGGGFVPGIVYHPTSRGLAYARTDMGGAYRWEQSAGKWIPMTDMLTRNNADYMGVLSIALDRNDTNRVYLQCGKYTQSWAGSGAVLSSTDKGNSWTIHPLPIKIGGNEDGRGTGERIQVDPNQSSILFMGTTSDGLWKSIDYGVSWKKVASFLPENVNFVRFDPASASSGSPTQRIFVAVVNTSAQSLYQSDDGGATWTVVPGQPNDVMAIRSDIADTLLIITTANSQGPNNATKGSVWKYGISSGKWTNISPTSGSYGFSGISVYPKNPNIMVVSTLDCWWPRDEVYLSVDGGTTWRACLIDAIWDRSYAPYTATVNPHWIATLEMDPFDSSRVMFGTGYGIWACDDLTQPKPEFYFKVQNFEETVPMQIISPPFTNLLSAMGDYDGFRHDTLDASPPNRYSPNKGTTLSIAFAERAPSMIVKTFNQSPYGAYSTNGGSTWQNFKTYPKGANQGGARSIAVSAGGSIIVWRPEGALMSYSVNNGKNWTACSGGVPSVPPVADRVNPDKFYAYDGVQGRMWVSTDGGKTFSQGAKGLPTVPSWSTQDGNVTAASNHEGDLWICCGSGGLYRSTTSGVSAQKITNVTEAYRLGFGRSSSPGGCPAVYFQGKVDGVLGIYRSDNVGESWTRINDDNHQFGWVHQVTGDPRVYGRCYVSAEGRGILYGEPEDAESISLPSTFLIESTNNDSLNETGQEISTTWTPSSDAQGNPLAYIMYFFGPGVDTIFTTTDHAAAFTVNRIQPFNTYVLTGYVTNGYDTTASSNSLFFHSGSLTTDVEDFSSDRPVHFALHPSYPNPFNPITWIQYDLLASVNVKVSIYNVHGQRVKILENEYQQAGSYLLKWDGTDDQGKLLSSGIYMCFIQAGELKQSIKLMMLK